MLQTAYQALVETLWTFCLFYRFSWSNQVPNLLVSQQLVCHDTFKIIIWSDIISYPEVKFIHGIQIICSLTHWGGVTHICVIRLTIIGSDNCLSPERHQAIIWTNAKILLIGPLGTNFSEILIKIQTFSLKKICLKMSSVKCCSFRLTSMC